jgi:Domain of unknown function (DUF5666)
MTDHDTETPMPDRDDRLLELDDPYEDDWDVVDEERDDGSLPPRRRRQLVTPVSAGLAAVLVAALGFIGGVQVQKHADKGGSGSANGAQAALASARGGGGGGGTGARGGFGGGRGLPGASGAGANGQSAPTIGSVANKNGRTLYVKDSDGNTVKVKTTSHSKINRTASTSAGAIHPGDTVIVQGTKSSSGTITATQINATASGAAGGLAGLFGGGGGFGGASGQGGATAPPPATGGSG